MPCAFSLTHKLSLIAVARIFSTTFLPPTGTYTFLCSDRLSWPRIHSLLSAVSPLPPAGVSISFHSACRGLSQHYLASLDTTRHILLCLYPRVDSSVYSACRCLWDLRSAAASVAAALLSVIPSISAVASPPDRFFLVAPFGSSANQPHLCRRRPARRPMASARPSFDAPHSRPLQLLLRHLTAPLTWNDWQHTLSWRSLPYTTFETYTACMAATFGVHWPLHIRPLLASHLQQLAAQITPAAPPAPELQHILSHLTAPLDWNSWQQLLSRHHLSPTTYTAYTAAMGQRFGPGWQQQTLHMTPAETALWQQQHSTHSHCPLPPEIHPLLTQLPHAITWNAWAMINTFGPSWAAAATALTQPELLQLTAAWQPTSPLPTPTTRPAATTQRRTRRRATLHGLRLHVTHLQQMLVTLETHPAFPLACRRNLMTIRQHITVLLHTLARLQHRRRRRINPASLANLRPRGPAPTRRL